MRLAPAARPLRIRRTLTALALVFAGVVPALSAQAPAQARRTIEDRTAGMRRLDGFFPLYYDSTSGQLFMEIARFNTEVLHMVGLGAGLGSNDIGLDRGQTQGERIVLFERAGARVMMVQPNYDFRSTSTNPAEVRAVRDGFARSVLWGFNVAAESDGGRRVLVDMTEFLVRDATNMAPRLTPGSYRLDNTRSSIYMPMTMNFPQNTEMEAELTFIQQPGAAGGGGRGGAFFEGVGSVAATAEAASLRLHHSFVQLPDNNYTPRAHDPRSGYGAFSFADYSAPLGESMTKRYIPRHRLKKQNPGAAMSDPVRPIVYYLDPGTPEPIRSALLEGGRWWNQAFEAAGYRNAFRVELLPEGVSTHDVRYNVINWTHRSTRGWSYGASVVDPRTGEIIKGVVTLGSLRVRQDWLLAEGLLSPYAQGNEPTPEIRAFALQRMKQLSAHEIGHTLGLGHNYYSSTASGGRISVMDYPHPLVTLAANGTLDISQAYTNEIGEWDKVTIAYGYQDFAPGTDEAQALRRILDDAWARDVRYMSNQDLGAHARVDQWSNGTDPAVELRRMMDVRRAALARFGENAIKRDVPMAQIEEALVPVYMHHRYQVDAAANVLGGMHYIYAMRGDGREPVRMASGAEQRAALAALTATLAPSFLALPEALLKRIPPRPPGYGRTREIFPRYTGLMFDAITPAVVAANHVATTILTPDRAARLVEQSALDPSLPGLEVVVDALFAASNGATATTSYHAEIRRAVERVVVEAVMALAENASMPQVRAVATRKLERQQPIIARTGQGINAPPLPEPERAHRALLATEVRRFLDRPAGPATRLGTPAAPPGAPIGDVGMEWITRVDLACEWAWRWE